MKKETIVRKLRINEPILITDYFNLEVITDTFYSMKGPIKEKASYFKPRYNVVWGDFVCNIKFNHGNFTDFLLLSANTHYAYPQQIAIGSVVENQIYLVSEECPLTNGWITFLEIEEKYFEDMKTREVPVPTQRAIHYKMAPTDKEIEIMNTVLKAKRRIITTMKSSNKF